MIGILAVRHPGDAGFTAGPDQHRHTKTVEKRRPAHQLKVMRHGLAKTEAGIHRQPVAWNAGRFGSGDPLLKEFIDLNRRKPIDRILLHGLRCAFHMHDDHRHPGSGSRLKRAIAAQTIHIIDNAGASVAGARHHLGMAGVDRQHRIGTLQPGYRRQNTRQFLIARHRFGPRAGGLPANIENIRARRCHRASGGDSPRRRVMPPTIGKTVGRDVQNAHDPRPVHRQGGEIAAGVCNPPERRLCHRAVIRGRKKLVRGHAAHAIGASTVALDDIQLVKTGPTAGDAPGARWHRKRAQPARHRKGRCRRRFNALVGGRGGHCPGRNGTTGTGSGRLTARLL